MSKLSEEEIIKLITYKLNMKNTDVYAPVLYDEIQGLLDLYQAEKEKNKELENADLTTVYMNGFYDGEKKWKDKIKEKIDIYKRFMETTHSNEYVKSVETLQELLEERN